MAQIDTDKSTKKIEETTTAQTATTDAPRPSWTSNGEKWLVPVAVGLGLLLIVGGIALLGLKKKQVAQLPDYSPVFVTPQASPSVSPSASPTPEPSPTPTQMPAEPENQTKGGIANGTVKGTTTVKKQAMCATGYLSCNDMVNASGRTTKPTSAPQQPLALPAYEPQYIGSELPSYQPNSGTSQLANYQPQYEPLPSPSPTPTVKQTISVSLVVPGKTYALEVRKDATVLELFQTAKSQGLSYATQSYSGLGEQITQINGQSQGDGKYWLYSINGRFATKGASVQTVNENDRVTWELK